MKKGKFAQHDFITSGKLKLQLNLQILLRAQGPMQKSDQRFISRTSKFSNIITIFTKLTKRITNREPKRLPIILVTYSLLTIFVS